jgi:hypothetical protein
MSQPASIVVFGVASSGSVEQWDRHQTPTGILLRWFLDPALDYPDLGFDIYRATVPDVPPLPFNDLNVPAIQGKLSWSYANLVTLATTASAGLRFAPSGPGWWSLIVSSAAPVTVTFSSPAWLVEVRANVGTTALQVVGTTGGTVVQQATLSAPGASITWRTRGIDQLVLSGSGSVSFIGYHLLGDAASWTQIAHRCLPVLHSAYRCAPPLTVTEANEARSRLPAGVAAEWSTRFDAAFAALLPAIRRWAIGAPASPIPSATGKSDIRLNADEQTAIELSMLDPHVARILGLAYDDPLGGKLDGREYVYKVVGHWLGAPIDLHFTGGKQIDPALLKSRFGLTIETVTSRNVPTIVMTFAHPVLDFSMTLAAPTNVAWTAVDSAGKTSSGTLTTRAPRIAAPSLSQLRLTWHATPPTIARLGWTPIVDELGLLPGIVATEPGPPPGPGAVAVVVSAADAPSAPVAANLDWAIAIAADGSTREDQAISYQVGHRQIGADPTAPQPVPTAPADTDLAFQGAPIFIAAAQALLPPGQRVLVIDRNDGLGFTGGWWGWWVRGVDLFGRVSHPSGWGLAAVVDHGPPPAPILVQAEWVQRNLPATTLSVLGRSTEAQRWLAASTAAAGLVASWAFGPDEAEIRPDVDGFRLLLRLPSAPSGAPPGTPLQYSDPWPGPIGNYGPMPIKSVGRIIALPDLDPIFDVTIAVIQSQPAAAFATSTDPVRSICQTDLELDGASGIFVGGSIVVNGVTFPVVANGDGPNLPVVVEHAAGAAPATGVVGQLIPPAGQLAIITTSALALTPVAGVRVRSGVLLIGDPTDARRVQVLGANGGEYVVRLGGVSMANGESAVWYPVWSIAIDDSGFGPVASDAVPVAHAQVAVESVRRIAATAVSSTPSAPLTVTAVDVTTPATPSTNAITFDPGDSCAVVASRADWYGKSRFTISWTAEPNRQFTVYRALGDEINRLDRLAHDTPGSVVTHTFPDPAMWPAGVHADATRRARVESELATLDQAFAVTDPAARQTAIDAAYQALTIDSQMLLAQQDYAWPAYAALFGTPISATSYEDTLEGRSRGHWFYRVTSRTPAGIESAPSAPTPPICCPDVVPPAPPIPHMALADAGQVRLRWLASAEADWDHYEVFADTKAAAGSELQSMTPVVVHAPSPHQGGTTIELAVARPPGEWCFWIVSVDVSGNRSRPSAMVKGRSLRAPPIAPVWQTPVRGSSGISLSWTHATDQRLACLVERQGPGEERWVAVTPWMPRGQYAVVDAPPGANAAWTYRVRVRDYENQPALEIPEVQLDEVP